MTQSAKNTILIAVIAAFVLYGWDYSQRFREISVKENAARQATVILKKAQVLEQLTIKDVVVGSGAEAAEGNTATLHYVGTFSDGKEFDNSRKRGQPIEFRLGAGQVIPGWDVGVQGMKVGGKRKLIIPPAIAYGANGTPDGLIPPNSTLYFTVELLAVK